MGLNANNVKSTSKSRPQNVLEPGSYPCRVLQVVDLGIQPQRPYKGEEKDPKQEILVVYEFADEFVLDEEGNEDPTKPRVISENLPLYNLSQEKANSTKRYNALDPEGKHGGEFGELVGTPCNVLVTTKEGTGAHAGKTFTNVSGISAMRAKDATKAPPLVNQPVVFEIDQPSMEDWENLYPWVQDKVKGALNFQGSVLDNTLSGKEEAPSAPEASDDDDTPY
jgi:hypothetical protein